MKTIKKLTSIFAIASLIFISCDNKKEKKVDDEVVIETSTNNAKTYTVSLDDGTKVTYYKDNYGVLTFNDWDGFNVANKEMTAIENMSYNTTKQRLEDLRGTVLGLENSIPAWLRTEEVMEDIADVKEEYNKLYNERNEPVKNVRQNWEELSEKFDDLREELNETLEKFKS